MAKNSIPQRGVYAITCTDGRAYIGSSINIEARWRSHRGDLRRGYHHNPTLQQLWSALGADAFTFEVVEEVPTGPLLVAEQRWMDRAISGAGILNRSLFATSSRGITHSAEARARTAAGSRANWTDPEYRAKAMRRDRPPLAGEKHPLAKLTEQSVRDIRRMAAEGISRAMIAAGFGVSKAAVVAVVNRKTWAHVA